MTNENNEDQVAPEENLIENIKKAIKERAAEIKDAVTSEIDATAFVQRLKLGADCKNLRVSGEISLRGCQFQEHISLVGCRFTGPVDFRSAKFDAGLDLSNCWFEDNLSLADARIDGLLSLKCAVMSDASNQSKYNVNSSAMDWTGLRVEGELDATDLLSNSAVTAANLRVAGILALNGIQIAGNGKAHSLFLQNAEIGGNLFARPFNQRRACLAGSVSLFGAKVGGQVEFNGAYLTGDLIMQSAEVSGAVFCMPAGNYRFETKGEVTLIGAKVGSNIRFEGASLAGGFTMQSAEVSGAVFCGPEGNYRFETEGEVSLAFAKVSGPLEFNGAKVKGHFRLDGAVIKGIFRAYPWESKMQSGKDKHVPAHFGSIYANGVTLPAGAFLYGVQVGCGQLPDNSDMLNYRGLVTFENAPELGDVLFDHKEWNRPMLDALDPNSSQRVLLRSWIGQRLDFSGAQLKGDLDLTGITVGKGWKDGEDDTPEDLGAIQARNLHVFGSIYCDELPPEGEADDRRSAWCSQMSLDTATIEGDLDLHGLEVGEKEQAEEAKESRKSQSKVESLKVQAGDLSLRGATVRGRVILWNPTQTSKKGSGAFIHGRLLAASLTATYMFLSGYIFQEEKESPPSRSRPCRLDVLQVISFAFLPALLSLFIAAVGIALASFPSSSLIALSLTSALMLLATFIFLLFTFPPLWTWVRPACKPGASFDLSHEEGKFWWWLASKLCNLNKEDASGRKQAWLNPSKTREPKVSLERAEIRCLRISEPLPGAIDIGHIQVDRWSLGLEHADKSEGNNASKKPEECYRDLLAAAEPFRRSNYTLIERDLRNRGDASIADTIRRDMMDRDRSDELGWLRTVLHLLHWTFGYGTLLSRLIGAIAIITVVSGLIFYIGGKDSGFDATRNAVAVGVPIVNLAFGPNHDVGWWHAQYRHKSDNQDANSEQEDVVIQPLYNPGVQCYAWIASAICFVLWPVFLAGLLPKVLGRRDTEA